AREVVCTPRAQNGLQFRCIALLADGRKAPVRVARKPVGLVQLRNPAPYCHGGQLAVVGAPIHTQAFSALATTERPIRRLRTKIGGGGIRLARYAEVSVALAGPEIAIASVMRAAGFVLLLPREARAAISDCAVAVIRQARGRSERGRRAGRRRTLHAQQLAVASGADHYCAVA